MTRAQGRGIRPRLVVAGGTLFEELGFYYVGPIDGHDSTSAARPEERAKRSPIARCWSMSSPRRARATRRPKRRRQISRRRQVRRRHRRSRPSRRQRAELHQGLRASADREAEPTTRSSPSPPRCRPAPASTCSAERFPTAPSTSASPSSMRSPSPPACRRRHEAVLRDLFDLPAARLRPGRARRRHPEAAGALRHGPRRVSSAPTARRTPARSMSAIWAPAGHGADGRRDEAELAHMVATAAAIDDRPSAFRYPRGEGVGVIAEEGAPLEIGKGRIVREGTSGCAPVFGARMQECLKAADKLAAGALHHRRRRALRQAARRPI
jgi:1-deoxy-D-xylulose-5-phosphate synthase